ncbi:MAG: nucleotidyltransferase domain-containing protein [Nanoarchaeota archaeon]
MAASLLSLLASGKSGLIWQLFLDDPRLELSQKEVRQLTKISTATAVKVLRSLVKEGVLVMAVKGNANFYKLADSSVNKQLKVARTVFALRPLSVIKDAYLFGSAARGEDSPESDIDILVIGKMTRVEIAAIILPLSRKLGRQIKPVSFSPSEWASMRKKDPAFYERVEKDKILL